MTSETDETITPRPERISPPDTPAPHPKEENNEEEMEEENKSPEEQQKDETDINDETKQLNPVSDGESGEGKAKKQNGNDKKKRRKKKQHHHHHKREGEDTGGEGSSDNRKKKHRRKKGGKKKDDDGGGEQSKDVKSDQNNDDDDDNDNNDDNDNDGSARLLAPTTDNTNGNPYQPTVQYSKGGTASTHVRDEDPEQQHFVREITMKEINTYGLIAVASAVCCSCLFGIPSIFYAHESSIAFIRGEPDRAYRLVKRSRLFAQLACAIGFLEFVAICVAIMVIFMS